MAAENCISLKNNRNAVKGENTWTGKMKKLKEMNLRAAENNAFDIETAEGMRQVADISNASIIKQLSLDESDYTDMLVEQRKMLTDLQRRVAIAEEKARLLLRENLDMKEYMTQKELPFEQFEVADRVLDGDFDVPDPKGYKRFELPKDYGITQRKLENLQRLAEDRAYYDRNPVKLMEDIMGISLFDSQAYCVEA